jgi:hypothetical protein
MQSSKRRQKKPKSQNAVENMERTLKAILVSQNGSSNVTPPMTPDIQFPLIKRNKVYTFVRSLSTTLSVTTTVDSTFAYAFSLGSFGDSTDFTNLFDAYRIQQVRVSFTPLAVVAGVVPSNIHTVIDYDDNNVISVAAMQEYESYQVDNLLNSFSRVLNPHAANAAYSGAFTSFSQMPKSTWCDVASPNILYYGLKGIIPASVFSGGPLTIFEVTTTAILQFKNTR